MANGISDDDMRTSGIDLIIHAGLHYSFPAAMPGPQQNRQPASETGVGMELPDWAALITGSGRGFGAATAFKFGQDGATTVAWDIVEVAVQQTPRDCRAAGATALVIAADVTDRTAM